jgi:hypothetical protein
MRIDSAIITGSFSVNGDTFNDLGIFPSTGSNTFVGNQSIVGAVSASALTGSISYTNLTDVPTLVSGSEQIVSILSPLNSFTASNSTTNTFTSSATARLNSIETITASNIARLTSLEITTGSLATTGSNTFIGTQTITGSLFVSSNLIVQGTSSLQNITASAVSIGTNIINLNTANPAIRYAGLVIGDSGSVGGSGSFLYDSVQDEMLFIHRGGSAVVTSSVALMGPETYDNVGNEIYLTGNIIPKGTGKEHLVDSCIFDNGTTTCIKNNLIGTGTINSVGLLTGQASIYQTDAGGLIASNRWGAYNGGSTAMSFLYNASGNVVWDNGAQRMVLTNTGNLGIGVDTPSYPLHVRCCTVYHIVAEQPSTNTSDTNAYVTFYAINNAGASQIRGYYGAGGNSVSNSSMQNHAYVGSQSNHGFRIFTNDTAKMTVTAAGNVGIGTLTPLALSNFTSLEVKGGTAGLVGVSNTTCTTFGRMYATGPVVFVGTSTNHDLILDTNDIGRMRISSGGSVGINTSCPNPSSLLHVRMCSNSNGDGIRVQAMCTGGAGSQPGIAFSNTSDCKRWNIAMDTNSDTLQITNAGGSNVFNVTQSCVVCLGPVATIGMQGGADTTVIAGGSGYGSAISMKFSSGAFNNYLAGNGDNYFNCVTGKLNTAGGIKFGGGSGILNHYETGTWVPQLYWGNGGYYCMGGINGGNYVRVGNVVHVNFHLQWSALCGSSGFAGQLRIGGLPYVVGGYRSAGTISAISFGIGRSGANITWHALTSDPGANFIYWIENDAAGGYGHSPSVGASGLVYSNQLTYTLH